MKRIYNYILTAAALVAFLPGLSAQGPNGNPHAGIDPTTGNPRGYQVNDLGIGYSKDITGPDKDGNYTIHLHTFVEGNGSSSKNNLPADVVLVLDVSGSMSENYTYYTYNELATASYSYSGWGYQTRYYLHTDGVYYRVQTGGTNSSNNNRRLWFTDNSGVTWYLSGSGSATRTQPAGVSNNTVIWEGILFTRVTNTTPRIDALKDAVYKFIDLIHENDPGIDGKHNQISIVKFAGDRYCDADGNRITGNENIARARTDATPTGNHKYNNETYNYTEVVIGFTDVSTDDGVTTLKNTVKALTTGGATAADFGMYKAEALINTQYVNNVPIRQSNKTVVFFTDGVPTHETYYDETVAETAILTSKNIKAKLAYTDTEVTPNKDYYTTVFSVGLLGSGTTYRMTEAQKKTYMERISSNYPEATGMDGTEGGTANTKMTYYQDASEGNLEDVFRSIASEAGGNQTLSGSTITAVDVVSQSFDIPDGASAITYYEAPVQSVASDGKLTFVPKASWTPNPAGVSVLPDENDPNKITATGFDYAKNYCGNLTIKEDGQIIDVVPHGSKLVIEIKIQMAGSAVGGPGVETNGPGSGIYVDGDNKLEFTSPTVDLPVNLQVKKSGLQKGESAKFMIQRIPKDSNPSTASENDWENVSTIFVTSTATGTEPDVFVRGLNPGYHYRILEENWDWSYNFVQAEGIGYVPDPNNPDKKVMGTVIVTDKTKVTSDKFITNPIKFTDKKKDNIESNVHHAESKAVNTFNGSDPVYVDSKDREKTTTPTNE